MKSLRPDTLQFTLFLSAAVALGPLATDMYLPSLPILSKVFAAPVSEVQWTLSVFMIGIASFQLVVGPLSDRFGRKNILALGLIIFAAACFGCQLATTIEELTFYRLLQSFGVCIAVVVPRAMVRDLFGRKAAALKLSRMSTYMGFAPALGPIIGGYVVLSYGWEGVFSLLGVYTLLVAMVAVFFMEETLLRRDLVALSPAQVASNNYEILSSSKFIGYAVTAALCFGGFFAYISGSSFVLINVMGVPTDHFGYYFGFVVTGFMGGTVLGPWLSAKFDLTKSLQVGIFLSLAGGSLLLALALGDILHPAAIVGPMWLYNVGVGCVIPQCQAETMHPFPTKAGAASALAGFIVLGFSAFLGLTVAELYAGTQMPMVTIVFLMGIATNLFFYLVVYPQRREHHKTNP